MKRLILSALLLASSVTPTRAQDVVQIGRAHGARTPEWIRSELARNPAAFEFKRAWKPNLEQAKRNRAKLRARGRSPAALSPTQALQQRTAVAGTFRVPVVTALYANTSAAPYTASALEQKLYTGSGVTLSRMYGEMSRSLLTLTGRVTEWVRVSQNDTHYEGADNGDKVGELLKEALTKVDQATDFSVYDANGDGYVDFVAFVHPESGGECGNTNIWSHRWNYESASGTGKPFQTNDGVKISDYVIQPALNCDGTSMIDIGVFAHEYGHAFGLPDLYATDRSNAGVGVWDLMGAGSWNRTDSPAHMSAWAKAELGWITVITLTSAQAGVRLTPVQTDGGAVRIDVPNSPGEYFLLENRQRLGTDRHLVQPGLLVWHVDSAKMAQRRRYNDVNNDATHKSLELVEADGRYDLRNKGGRSDTGDPFPGSSSRTLFGRQTTPSSVSFGGAPTGITLRDIVDTGAGGAVTFDFSIEALEKLWGDVTGDYVVDRHDLAALLKRVAGAPVTADFTHGDVDGDGAVGPRDALIVKKYISGVDVSQFRVGGAVGGSNAPRRASRP